MRTRRTLLRGTGAVLGGIAVAGTSAARQKGEAPSGNVEVDEVHPFAGRDDPLEVSAGNWINHYVRWIDVYGGDTRQEDIESYIDAVEVTVRIDGEPVEDTQQYWGEPEMHEMDYDWYDGEYDEVWSVRWEYVTEPKSRGTHKFELTLAYPDGYVVNDEVVREPGYEGQMEGYYEVK